MTALRRVLLISLLALSSSAAIGCGGKAKGAAAPAAAADGAVQPGDGWTRTSPGVWTYDPGTDGENSTGLIAPAPARGIERITLPTGATGATVAAIETGLVGGGSYRWTVHAVAGDDPGELGAQLGAGEITATLDDGHGAGNPQWFETALSGVTTTGGFDLVFETIDGAPAVAAIDSERNVYFQPSPDDAAKLTPFTAYVRVVLTDVH